MKRKDEGRSSPENLVAANVQARTRALNVIVPAAVHKRARVAAAQSGMSFKNYIAKLLEKAEPIAGENECS